MTPCSFIAGQGFFLAFWRTLKKDIWLAVDWIDAAESGVFVVGD
jgi:hypothetical protein